MTPDLLLFRGDPEKGKYVEFIQLDSLSFMYTQSARSAEAAVPAVVHGIGAQNCAVRNCTMKHIGSRGVWFEPVPGSNIVAGNTICDVLR